MPSTTDGSAGDGSDGGPRREEGRREQERREEARREEARRGGMRDEGPPAPRDLLAMDARRRHAIRTATQRVDRDLARAQDEALPHLAVTVLATCGFLVVAFALARMTDGLWWIAPVVAAGGTGISAVAYARTAAGRTQRRTRLRRPWRRSGRNRPD
ncbi:hypothetical protein ACFCZ1_29045 [Streptomyces sp. NPDC056224]|uniref:hypothetical protein n=1 Tax=Streptomyces sp. NPDC056224 TaxID=3345750 RepID=UPI0035E346EA